MTQINIVSETKTDRGWAYSVQLQDGSSQHNYSVTLSESDYQKWAGDRVSPAETVKTAFEFLLDRESASSILSQFDCSVIRRYFPEVDRELPKQIG